MGTGVTAGGLRLLDTATGVSQYWNQAREPVLGLGYQTALGIMPAY